VEQVFLVHRITSKTWVICFHLWVEEKNFLNYALKATVSLPVGGKLTWQFAEVYNQ
jgi:hypothetical protein